MNPNLPIYIIFGALFLVVFIALVRSIRIVPGKMVMVVERLGKYSSTLESGFHILVPFIDKVRYKHSLKERAVDVPSQSCFTLDNVKVNVDGVLYFQVVDPKKASYGIRNYEYATIQLAQTTMRSVMGKLELDKTFEVREKINGEIVQAVDEASDPWGVRVTRYEIQNISVPDNVLQAMEVQMRAEREKRADIARSIGVMEAKINSSQAQMEEVINRSDGEKNKLINEAQGKAEEILTLSKATAESIDTLAEALKEPGGEEAVTLRIAETYIHELGNLARRGTKLTLPMDLTDIKNVRDIVEQLVKG